ncbi:MAG: Aspartyl/glutamyl-tRNA(Asn/Gln) amidotransferase subunit, partial [Geminicoccaceae bacterium]|nr:Aspartyl/glutamyl-tRNA(Asn/Gln) amidotransferase subunit [Geminicoccaceae bacterium]
LTGILAHMDVLSRVNTTAVGPVTGVGAAGTPLRVDGGNQIPLARPREAFAPAMRDGFFLVPRLATHEDQRSESS